MAPKSKSTGKRKRGSGGIFRKKKSPFFYIQYYTPGNPRPILESSKSTVYGEAQKLLTKRMAEVEAGVRAAQPDRVLMADLFRLYESHHRMDKSKGLEIELQRLNKHVSPFFGQIRAARFSLADVRVYIEKRRADGRPDSTINRELSIVRQSLRLGHEETPPMVLRVLKIPKLDEHNIRQGFMTDDEYHRLLSELPEYLKLPFIIGYHTGVRKGELLAIRWTQVSFEDRLIRLKSIETKSGSIRALPIYGDMEPALRAARERHPKCTLICVYDDGDEIKDTKFYSDWRPACERAGVPDLLFHDLRRTAARNMVSAGIPDSTARAITGHKTRAMFDRYNIVVEGDIRRATEKLESSKSRRSTEISVKPDSLDSDDEGGI